MSATQATPRGMRLHIGIFGRRNVGKSSLINMIANQDVSIVSEVAGATADPVEKPMELLPLGPVLFIDTAGLDDVGALGKERALRSRRVFDRTELAILVIADNVWGVFEEEVCQEFKGRGVPLLVAFNKCDETLPSEELVRKIRDDLGLASARISAKDRVGLPELKRLILENAGDDWFSPATILSDLIPPDGTAVLVIPIDKEAPKGRLILPQVQVIRDLLDHGQTALVTRETELKTALGKLATAPDIVVTDSQAFQEVAQKVPREIPLTGFSVLFARLKGDLGVMIEGTRSVAKLKPGAKILVAESCSHHPIGEDIGRVKIPRWLTNYVGGALEFHHVQGHDFPENLTQFDLIIQCGGCMTNRRAILSRIMRAKEQNVPITNYGLIIAFSLGIFERAVEPFLPKSMGA
ncbi:MAG: [FeFe] hydrogenase H-cluster maturation GTPase HydF [Planctomycetia bacterium]|nr:[FeFe] hydrogenase H-cluster maturation GTPase HydF [Planctomycetia bacterium]